VRFYFGPDKPLIRRHREDDPETAVMASSPDEVGAAIAALLEEHGQQYQTLNNQAEQFHDAFRRALP